MNCILGSTLQKVLSALDCLDQHCFDKVDSTNSLETLYTQIFSTPPVKDNPAEADAPIVLLLCQWAVGPQRTGEHRALAVARLLEHRQSEVLSSSDGESQANNGGGPNSENGSGVKGESSGEDVPMIDSENGASSEVNGLSNNGSNSNINNNNTNNNNNNNGNDIDDNDFPNGLPIYHNLLFRFLDSDAPTLGKSY